MIKKQKDKTNNLLGLEFKINLLNNINPVL